MSACRDVAIIAVPTVARFAETDGIQRGLLRRTSCKVTFNVVNPDPREQPHVREEIVERTMIVQALQQARFNKSKAARTLGLTRQQLYVRLRRYGLE